jgi:hypothetical protein
MRRLFESRWVVLHFVRIFIQTRKATKATCEATHLRPRLKRRQMKIRVVIALAVLSFAPIFTGCTNTQPAYYGTYPSDFDFGPNHGYDAYAAAPYDPYGAYYQNFSTATPYYYEPPESHRDCDARPCIAYRRDAAQQSVAPEIIALPQKAEPLNPPSTIARSPHTNRTPRRHHAADDSDR